MKKSLLSLSIGAAVAGLTLAGAANAAVSIAGTNTGLTATTANATLELNPGGIGHIGVIPYFSTQNGNQTLFSITNTDTVNGKAVKVRFRSAANSDDIFDFTLFLSPGDVWTANISKDPTGISRVTTTDNSCTLPAAPAINRGFVTDRLPRAFSDEAKANWTREGYIEVLTMADIPPNTGTPAAANPLFTAIKHVAGTAPCTDATLSKLTVATNFNTEAKAGALGLDTPTTGLYTNAILINTANAFLSWSNEATAIQAVTFDNNNNSVPARGRLVFAAQTNDNVDGVVENLTADPLLRATSTNAAGGPAGPAPITALEFDFPDLSTPYTGVGANDDASATASPRVQSGRLSASLAVTAVKNDYSTLAAIGSKTDFTFSLPTRRYHAAVDYGTATGNTPATVRALYTPPAANQGIYFTTGNTSLNGSLLCVKPTSGAAPITVFDRSERTLTTGNGAVVSPGTATPGLAFCGEVSVLTVNNNPSAPAGAGVLGSGVAVQNVFTGYQEGWINIATDALGNGLPVLGSAFTSAIGAPANGVSTNYAWAFKHKTVPANRPVAN